MRDHLPIVWILLFASTVAITACSGIESPGASSPRPASALSQKGLTDDAQANALRASTTNKLLPELPPTPMPACTPLYTECMVLSTGQSATFTGYFNSGSACQVGQKGTWIGGQDHPTIYTITFSPPTYTVKGCPFAATTTVTFTAYSGETANPEADGGIGLNGVNGGSGSSSGPLWQYWYFTGPVSGASPTPVASVMVPPLQIVQTIASPASSVVVSVPAPYPSVEVGTQVVLSTRIQPGYSGWMLVSGTTYWRIDGTIWASYTLNGSLPVLSTLNNSGTFANPATFYWPFSSVGAPLGNFYSVLANATLFNGSQNYKQSVAADFVVFGPTVSSNTVVLPPVVAIYTNSPGAIEALSVGSQLNYPATAGMKTRSTITVPPQSNGGYVVQVQLIANTTTAVHVPSPWPFTSTIGQELDTDVFCDLQTVYPGDNMFDANDAPASQLSGTATSAPNATVSTTKSFQDFLLYRPFGPPTTWVPLAKTPVYTWSGTALRTAVASPNPPSSPGWVLQTSVPALPKFVAAASTSVPTWSAVYTPQPDTCPTAPPTAYPTSRPTPSARPTKAPL